ncbi:MAG: hypothetical protein SAJ12_14840 [Jaaginema sp. PMC 1079.18]|nr:hypothetical protein [Jaaginema sp. PMC 1080.18]MEC4852262.1 hypothetical protein [Jaaginema sp. PMC 1079.18]MEC4866250.1 hypothetical protein [Jaaginema sp. PMC 1078.18]
MSIALENDDVLRFEEYNHLLNVNLCEAKKLQDFLKEQLTSGGQTFFGEGLECEHLSAQKGGGWQKVQIRVRLEIVPVETLSESALVPIEDNQQE